MFHLQFRHPKRASKIITASMGMVLLAVMGCVHHKEAGELVLKGSIAESRETVAFDPVVLARQQKQVEQIFFGDAAAAPGSDLEEDGEVVADLAPEVQPHSDSNMGALFANENFILWPVKGEVRISSLFGMRKRPGRRHRRFHAGVDISAPRGEEVLAVADGQVIIAANKRRSYGNVIILNHAREHRTLYAHLSKILVREGQVVKAGQLLGTVGNSGNARGYHLHFETRVADGTPQNPLKFLPTQNSQKGWELGSLKVQGKFKNNTR